jgi:hypothetical protein
MTDPTEPVAPSAEPVAEPASDIDFEHASFEQPQSQVRACKRCQRPITASYFAHGGAAICPTCEPEYRSELGSGSFATALGYGLLAAALGALLWYGVRALTGYELGLIAIVIGVAVGFAVRKGAGSNASIVYRLLALGLAYSSIVASYIPMLAADVLYAESAPAEGVPTADGSDTIPEPTVATEAGDGSDQPGGGAVIAAYIFATGFAFILPFLMLADGQVMGVIIIGIGLWEAWRRSAPDPEDQLTGPFETNSAGA